MSSLFPLMETQNNDVKRDEGSSLNEVMLGLIWVLSEEAIICFHRVMFANQHKAILASLTDRTELINKVEFYFTHKIIVYLFLY